MKATLSKLTFQGSKMKVGLKISEYQEKLEDLSVSLTYRSKLEERKTNHLFQGKWKGDCFLGSLDLSEQSLVSIYYDLLVIDPKGEEVLVQVGPLRNLLRNPLYDGKYMEKKEGKKNGMFLHPFITPEKTLAFQYRERTKADTRGFRIGEFFVCLIYFLTSWYYKKQNIYLIYEKFCMMAQDNSYYFFRYCMEADVEKKLQGRIYYIIDKNSPDLEKLMPYKDHLIYFMSFRHKLYLLACKLMVSTDTRKHAYAWRKRMSFIDHFLRHKPLVFLQHGVTAFKKVDYIYGKGKFGECNIFVTTSDYEKEIVRKNFGYQEHEIAVTGFARWDVLEDCSQKEKDRMILIMPTWRNWLEEVDEETFKESDYYKEYYALLNSVELKESLEREDLKLCFYIHPKFRDYIAEFHTEDDRIEIIPFGSQPLNEIMMRCRLLVTDYSSVAWDVYYQKKPVIFYQFDLAKYEEAHGSYMDMSKELFGPQVKSSSDLIKKLEEFARKDFALDQAYLDQHSYYFKYVDHDNSKRIVEAIADYRKIQ